MKNIDLKVKNDKLVITVDLTKNYGLSKTGKSTTIASTLGNKPLASVPDVYVGVNVYKKS